MNQHDNEKLDPQDPERMHMQPPIPTHPADPQENGEADKVAVSPAPELEPRDPAEVSHSLGIGAPMDNVGGPGLGLPPDQTSNGAGDEAEKATTVREREVRAVDQQDRTGQA